MKTEHIKKIKSYVGKIVSLSIEVGMLTEHDVFIDYSGHVKSLDIDIHIGGWVRHEYPTYHQTISIGKDRLKETDLVKVIKVLKFVRDYEKGTTNFIHDLSKHLNGSGLSL